MNSNMRVFVWVALALAALFAGSLTALADDSIRLPAMPEMQFSIRWPLSSVVFMPNGSYLAAADDKQGVYLWNLKSRKKEWEVELPIVGSVSNEDVALAFTGDGKTLLLASDVRDPLVLDASSGKTLRSLGSEGEWFAPAISIWRKDRTEKAVTSSSGDLHLWNPSDGKEVLALKRAGRTVVSLQVARDVPRIVLGLEARGAEEDSDTGRVLVRELPSGRILFDVRQSKFPVRQLAISPKGDRLVGASDGQLVCWSIDRKERLWSKKEECRCLAMSSDGKTLAYGSDSRLVLCDVLSGTAFSETRYGSRSDTISAVTFSGDATSIAVGTEDGAIAIWRLLPGLGATDPGQRSERR